MQQLCFLLICAVWLRRCACHLHIPHVTQERYKPENMILYAVLDGPSKPKCLQKVIRRLVDRDLMPLLNGVAMWHAGRSRLVTVHAQLLLFLHDTRGSRPCTCHQDPGKTSNSPTSEAYCQSGGQWPTCQLTCPYWLHASISSSPGRASHACSQPH